ncbi:hypothetical protein P171DRAFT_119274 [Karstenula rhodostoma CBS 690.94]|uniref:Uncharacterized protein n=1 Tax=Karstenula rhodostoma CBS 690.94 TaxID=1392251 RepID=A0A9P4U6I0_9PLEO|nr:hypothetical protein P171DRAFT_119274 [Karstenula rhodostoma CBS 690.94]
MPCCCVPRPAYVVFGCWLRRTCCTAPCFRMHTSAPSPSFACAIAHGLCSPSLLLLILSVTSLRQAIVHSEVILLARSVRHAVCCRLLCDTMHEGRTITHAKTPIDERTTEMIELDLAVGRVSLWLRRFVWGLNLLAAPRAVLCLPCRTSKRHFFQPIVEVGAASATTCHQICSKNTPS